MSTTRHPRKSGATTIKRDGKIIGNIGKGKIKVPTVSKTQIPTPTTESPTISILASRSETFKTLTAVTENGNSHSEVNRDTLQVVWNLSKSQSMKNRMDMLSAIIDNASFEEQKSFIENLKFSEDEVDEMILFVGFRITIPANIINLLAYTKENTEVKICVANSKEVLPETLAYLSDDNDILVRINVAADEKTPPNILAKLSRKRDMSIRLMVAKNPNTPPEVLQHYIGLKNADIQETVALNPSLTPNMCKTLAESLSVNVHMNLIVNRATPDDVLEDFVSCPESGKYYERVVSFAKQELEKRKEGKHVNI